MPLAIRNCLEDFTIKTLIAEYLSKNDLIRCIRVNLAWNTAFLPLIWNSMRFQLDRSRPPFDVLQRHSDLVERLYIDRFLGAKFDTIVFPNLHTMEIHNVDTQQLASISIACSLNPTIAHLVLNNTSLSWSEALEQPRLNSLEIQSWDFEVNGDFWTLCTRLERLLIRYLHRAPDNVAFPEMKHLEITGDGGLKPSVVRFASQCRNLGALLLPAGPNSGTDIVHTFVHHATTGTWPKLQRLRLSLPGVSDMSIGEVLRSMQECLEWNVGKSSFGPASFMALRDHFWSIRFLNLKQCSNVTSEMIQEILSSCPHLTVFKGDQVESKHIVSGQPWVCQFMTELDIYVNMASGTNCGESVQWRVFAQLSMLYSLRTLRVGFAGDVESFPPSGLDFRLCMGLDLLRSLTRLRTLSLVGTRQSMGVEEVNWMLRHWRNMEYISGALDSNESQHNNLAEILGRHGVQANQ
ncbi:hypothetical protein B0O80DRAFT_221270 [Mortierella sp. GBAus27b]|nr:hypothetical protein B0O80DRAFT_221270 [Mortierella sp. GBAus27b]